MHPTLRADRLVESLVRAMSRSRRDALILHLQGANSAEDDREQIATAAALDKFSVGEETVPSAEEVRAALAHLTMKQIDRLAEISGVPPTTIYKIKRGETKNPGVETLRQFMPHVDAAGVGLAETPTEEGAG